MYCSPTRSSFHSGRFPYHVNQIILSNDGSVPDWGVPKGIFHKQSGRCLCAVIWADLDKLLASTEMTMLPEKLKQAGYATHASGSNVPT